MLKFLSRLFDSNEKQLNKAQPIIDKINSLEEEYKNLSDDEMKAKTEQFKKLISPLSKDLSEEKEKLEELIPHSFALVREASRRIANHRHYDVQVLAGYFLFHNNIIELFTGEGKTLAANMPLYLYGLTGKGAHLVTTNDYLARRDAEWNGHILGALGVTVGAINNDTQFKYITDEEAIELKRDDAKRLIQKRDELIEKAGRMKYDHMLGVNLIECSKKEAYACDVVYGTNNEFGFDYLRDNMVRSLEDRVQGELHFAIVDEADSILIDEARTPLIISSSAQKSNEMYYQFASLVKQLEPEKDYTVDEKANSVMLNEDGMDHVEKLLKKDDVYSNPSFAYHLDNALKAKELYKLDDEYIVREGQVFIVDQFTGRVMEGRRYSEGLHQAIEAKEGVEVKKESKTIATITLQNYFRLYDFLSGMTATALTEAEEFADIYNLDVVVVPTDKPVIRKDHSDVVYRTMEGKFDAIARDVKEHNEKGQPVLLGTTSVEKSEYLSKKLKKEGVPHNVLNAKHHEKEAKIVADAGQKGSVTIATNMAGRGTDIALGEGVTELGGLYVIGSERHESRRIDNQLRGRAGRQGDPGESRFYVSFEDDLMRIFGGERMNMIMARVGMDDDMPIASSILGRTIESAQKKVEGYHYDVRKRLVEFDDVLNQQREIIYGLRRNLLEVIEVKDSGKVQSDIEKIKAKVKELDVDRLSEELDAFTMQDHDLKISELEKLGIKDAVSAYLLKKIKQYTSNILAVQLSEEDSSDESYMEVDNAENRRMIKQIHSLLGEELTEEAVKLLGEENVINYLRKIDKEKLPSVKENLMFKLVVAGFIAHVAEITLDAVNKLGKVLILQSIDQYWMEHLDTMADLREGIYLRSMANKDPLTEYKNEGFGLFEEMLANIDTTIVKRFFKIRIVKAEDQTQVDLGSLKEVKADPNAVKPEPMSVKKTSMKPLGNDMDRAKMAAKMSSSRADDADSTFVRKKEKPGRNDPCPCGSGKKYKKCCYPKYD